MAQIKTDEQGGWMLETGAVARAFELANGGNCHRPEDIGRQLRIEHYRECDAHLVGRIIKLNFCSL
jgi:hypothetical protein